MAKTIIIDNLVRGPLWLIRNPDGSLRLEASYILRAGADEVRSVNRDVTSLLTPAQRTALTDAYNSAFTTIETIELS